MPLHRSRCAPAHAALLAVALLCTAAAAQDVCGPPYVEIQVYGAGDSTEGIAAREPLLLIGALAQFGPRPDATTPTPAVPLTLADPLDACADLGDNAQGSIVLVTRGNCTFYDKAQTVQRAGGVAMLQFDNQPGCIVMVAEANASSTGAPPVSIPSISLTHAAGEALAATLRTAATPPRVTLQYLDLSPLDASSLILFILAVGTVVAGALWCGVDHAAVKAGDGSALDAAPLVHGPPSEAEVMNLTVRQAAGFIVVASTMLLILFYFLNKVFFYILLWFFGFASGNALVVVLAAAAGQVAPKWRPLAWDVPCCGPTPLLVVAATPPAAVVVVTWILFRNAGWAWVLQDILGVALMLLVLRTLRLSSLRVACVLLPLCFLYDVFWVFISPLLFSGQSVMVEVARGGAAQEALPMLLRVPRFSHHELGGYSMLGFGDIILPGLLVAYTRRLDMDMALPALQGYFVPCTVGYAAGLLTTYAALLFSWFGDQGQPALLYLVPCTLGTVLILAAWRRHLPKLMAEPEHGEQQYRQVMGSDHEEEQARAGVRGSDAPRQAGDPEQGALDGFSSRGSTVGLRRNSGGRGV